MPDGKRRVTFARLARLDLNELTRYSVEVWGEKRAIEYTDSLLETIHLLVEHPYLGPQHEVLLAGRRRIRAKSHHVYYRIMADEIRILRILHETVDVSSKQFRDQE